MKSLCKKIYNKILNFLKFNQKNAPPIIYWQNRVRQYKERAVFNLGHSKDQIQSITKMQKNILLPYFSEQLNGNERILLDLGCGSGRFTPDLAQLINGKAVGIDPIEELIDIAKKNAYLENCEFKLMREGVIPMDDASVDIVWVCLVLGGIIDDGVLKGTLSEIKRVLKKNGLIFLVENTTENKINGNYWKFRSVEDYQAMFIFTRLKYLSGYIDLNEEISIMVGRKNV